MQSVNVNSTQRWHEISTDPCDPRVMKSRQEGLNRARVDELVADRLQYMCDLVRDKDILDIGVVAHTRDAVNAPEWLHKNLAGAARSCLGVDILVEDVNYLKSLGFNVICADIIQQPLEQKFDTIVCGEVLEHVNAPGDMLGSIAKMLKPGGKAIVSVPNPWYINAIVKNLFQGDSFVDNVDHVCWFDPCTLAELGERQGFKLERFVGITANIEHAKGGLTKLLFGLKPIFIAMGFRPEIYAKTLSYELVLSR